MGIGRLQMTPSNLDIACTMEKGSSHVLRTMKTWTELTSFCMSSHRLLPSMANMVTVVVSICKSLSRTSLLQRTLLGQVGKVLNGDPAINATYVSTIITISSPKAMPKFKMQNYFLKNHMKETAKICWLAPNGENSEKKHSKSRNLWELQRSKAEVRS